jgi:hypothetical protein
VKLRSTQVTLLSEREERSVMEWEGQSGKREQTWGRTRKSFEPLQPDIVDVVEAESTQGGELVKKAKVGPCEFLDVLLVFVASLAVLVPLR